MSQLTKVVNQKSRLQIYSKFISSVAQLCPTLCDPMGCSTLGFPVHHQLPEFTQLMSIESVMPSNHLILCRPLLLLPPIPPSIRVFSNESVLHIRWPKCWSFSFSISPSNECLGLISFRMDWLDLLAAQGTLKSLLQHHSSKASILLSLEFTPHKSRDIILPAKICLVRAMAFPVVMYECDWTTKKAEPQRIGAFELWCWRRLLRVPWAARRSNQCILKDISLNIHWKDWCWSWNSNTLATWCQLTHLKRPWCWNDWRWKEKGTTEDEMVGWHHRPDGHKFE